MGVDFNKARNKAQEEAAKSVRSQFSFVKYWTPKVGTNRVRLMPPWTNKGPNTDQFWREIHMHWNMGPGGYLKEDGRQYTCTVKTPDAPANTPCDACSYVQVLRQNGTMVDLEIAKEISARQRCYSNIVDLNDSVWTQNDYDEWRATQKDPKAECPFSVGHTKVQVWTYGQLMFKELLDIFTDGIDITRLDSGKNIIITREGKTKETTKYRIRLEQVESRFEFIGKPVEEALVNLDNLMPFPQPGEIRKLLDGGASGPPQQMAAPSQVPGLPPKTGWPSNPNDDVPAFPTTSAGTTDTDEPPQCFKNTDIFSESDPECVGGEKNGENYDKCPWFTPCRESVLAILKPPQGGRRRTVQKATPQTTDAVADIERQMREALK